jgi:hypothetical protein
MPRIVHPGTLRARVRQLRAEGHSQAGAAAVVGVHPRTIRAWERTGAELDVHGLPVRLRIERGALRDRLLLERGHRRLAVLGVRRAGGWDLSLGGEAHAQALACILPALIVRASLAAPVEPHVQAEAPVLAWPKRRAPSAQ